MITILHRGGGGSLGTPKSDYVICARPHMSFLWAGGGRGEREGGGREGGNQHDQHDLDDFHVDDQHDLDDFHVDDQHDLDEFHVDDQVDGDFHDDE